MYPFKLVDVSARNPLGKQIIAQRRREVISSIDHIAPPAFVERSHRKSASSLASLPIR
jgi:hypothetical protein